MKCTIFPLEFPGITYLLDILFWTKKSNWCLMYSSLNNFGSKYAVVPLSVTTMDLAVGCFHGWPCRGVSSSAGAVPPWGQRAALAAFPRQRPAPLHPPPPWLLSLRLPYRREGRSPTPAAACCELRVRSLWAAHRMCRTGRREEGLLVFCIFWAKLGLCCWSPHSVYLISLSCSWIPVFDCLDGPHLFLIMLAYVDFWIYSWCSRSLVLFFVFSHEFVHVSESSSANLY
jgi:hypothetical protein